MGRREGEFWAGGCYWGVYPLSVLFLLVSLSVSCGAMALRELPWKQERGGGLLGNRENAKTLGDSQGSESQGSKLASAQSISVMSRQYRTAIRGRKERGREGKEEGANHMPPLRIPGSSTGRPHQPCRRRHRQPARQPTRAATPAPASPHHCPPPPAAAVHAATTASLQQRQGPAWPCMRPRPAPAASCAHTHSGGGTSLVSSMLHAGTQKPTRHSPACLVVWLSAPAACLTAAS